MACNRASFLLCTFQFKCVIYKSLMAYSFHADPIECNRGRDYIHLFLVTSRFSTSFSCLSRDSIESTADDDVMTTICEESLTTSPNVFDDVTTRDADAAGGAVR